MPNYLDYQVSITKEFKAFQNRLRYLIDDHHWGEEGKYKEVVLMSYLKRVLPKSISVGTGFVRNNEKITSQIDIIIYDNTVPTLFSEGDFVITTPDNVIGIIEVKTKVLPNYLKEIVEKANKNGEIIRHKSDIRIFNGIFSYDGSDVIETYESALTSLNYETLLERSFNEIMPKKLQTAVNHIVLGEQNFIKLWPFERDESEHFYMKYSMYRFNEKLGIAYFLSNLQELILRRQLENYIDPLDSHYQDLYYPIREDKEVHNKGNIVRYY